MMASLPVPAPQFRHTLRLVDPDTPRPLPAGSASLLINGWPFFVLTWSSVAWAGLRDKPSDAIPSTDGSWVALRSA